MISCVGEYRCEVFLLNGDHALLLVILEYNGDVFSFAFFVVECDCNLLGS